MSQLKNISLWLLLLSPVADAQTVALDRKLLVEAQRYFSPLPTLEKQRQIHKFTDAQVELGHQLFFDKRLSKHNNQSCTSCHNLSQGGADPRPVSPGSEPGVMGVRNAPTVFNAALNTRQFWDGRAKNVREQASRPLLNPLEMALSDEAQVEAIIAAVPGYGERFARAFEDKKISFDNITNAIGAYEQTLLTPSPWDEYLGGKIEALSPQQRQGLRKFIDHGCVSCHNGVNLGGVAYQKFGLVQPYWELTGSKKIDEGRFAVTGREEDKYFFRVPGLRQVSATAPYFHDGSVAKLDDAIDVMARAQYGRSLPQEDIRDMVLFLQSTAAPLPAEVSKEPVLP